MEKMNQVSVSEFFAKSKEEMYDDAVAMVDKYNRLVDICNDSAERMAELMAKDDINEFKKELQSKAPGEFKIQKLADIVVWADGIIRDAGYNEEKYKSDGATAYCHVKAHELWKIRDVALESMERQTVYSNALNRDIADKAAKIDLLEKEIEGRKEGYIALKVLMDTKYISIDEHNDICKAYEKKVAELKKESEKWQDLAKMNRDTICNQYDVCEDFKKKIAELEEENEKLKADLIHEREKNEKLAKDHAELENDIRKYTTEIKTLEEKVKHQKENLDGINKTLEIRTKENESLIKVRNNLNKEIEAHESENARLSEKIMELKKANGNCAVRVGNLERELDKACTTKELDLKGHNRREMALVNELADKNDEIKSLKEENSYLKSEIKQKQNIIKKAYERYSDDIIKTRKDLMEVAYRDIKKDNGYVGFKLYVKSALIEAKGDKNEANEIITEAVRSAYTEWDKTQKENEKTIKKAIKEVMNKKYGYAGEIAFCIRSEVDKKRIVDIGEGAEKILGVSRELFDAAIKALVDDGYQEIIGRIPQATNSYVYMDMHVLATPDVETRETANAENIKSLDFDIPCGEDAIE